MQKSESGVAEHVRESDHFFDFKNAKIIYPSKNVVKRHIVESTLISTLKKSNKTCNLNLGFAPHNEFLTKHLKEIINLEEFGYILFLFLNHVFFSSNHVFVLILSCFVGL